MANRKYHPTCHKVPLVIASKVVAFCDMALGLMGLVWFVLMLSRYSIISLDPFENIDVNNDGNGTKASNFKELMSPDSSATQNQKQVFATNHKVINLTLVAFYTIVNLTVFVILLVGIYRRSPGVCLIWFYIRCAIFVFKLIILFMYIIGGRPLFSQIPFLLSMLLHLYGLWIVNSYVEELRGNIYEDHVKEVQERNEQNASEERNNDDSPNGIEALQKKRMAERLDNVIFHSNDEETTK